MAINKSDSKAGAKTKNTPVLDPKLKWLVGLALVTAGLFIFLKSPTGQKLGINIDGMKSDASYGSEYADTQSNGKEIEFQGGPESACTATACADTRISVTEPSSETRLTTRKTHQITWKEDESIESRFHTITIEGMGCGESCPEPYVIVNRTRNGGSYNWSIGSFLPVPQYFQNTPVWLRVSTSGRYDSNGQPQDFYSQIPVVLTNMTR